MKSILWISLILILTVIGVIPFHQQKSILVKAKYENVFDQLLKPVYWKNWQPDVKAAWQHDSARVHTIGKGLNTTIEAPGLHIETRLNGFGLDVRKNTIWHTEHYGLTILINKNFQYTDINVVARTCGFKWLIALVTRKGPFEDMEALKQYMEDDKAYYGFHIGSGSTVDTNVLVVKKIVPLKGRDSAITATQKYLQAYINVHHYQVAQPVIADIHTTYGSDSVRLMMGIPIIQSPKLNGDIKLMQMPALGRQLYITYTGKYGGRMACYKSLRRYITDHGLATPEVPYEKYLDNKIPLSDTDYTHMQIICPVQ